MKRWPSVMSLALIPSTSIGTTDAPVSSVRMHRIECSGRTQRRLPLPQRIDFGQGPRRAMTIPWGDVSTAWYTTGIPDIEVYVPSSAKLIKRLRQMNVARPVLGTWPVQKLLKSIIQQRNNE